MPTPTIFEGINPRGTQTLIPCKDVSAFPRSEQAVLGAKNLLPMTIDKIKSSNTLGTWTNNTYVFAGCTFECVVKNGIVTQINVSGTATTNINFTLYNVASNDDKVFIGKRITMSGCPNTGSLSSYYLNGYRLGVADGSGGTVQDVGDGITFDFLNNGSGIKGWIAISIANEQAILNAVVFKPMLRLATNTDSTYVPYAMTNRELTEKVAFNNVEITNVNAGITLDTAWSYAYQVGNLVIYALRFTVGASAINENTILCSFGAECSKSMNADILPRQTGNHFLAALVADTTNHRTDFKTFGGATLTASNEYLVSGVYIAK